MNQFHFGASLYVSIELILLTYYIFCLGTHVLAIIYGYSRLYSWKPQPQTDDVPGVSLIKPIIGFDKNLKTNLESFFNINYPKYELLICVAEREVDNPPSLPLIKELIQNYPKIDVKVITGAVSIGVNPKINNMFTAYQNTQYDLLWFTDANIITLPDTLTELVSKISSPKVGLVHQLPYYGTAQTYPEYLNKIYFGTQQARAYLVANFLGVNCTTGMSLLIKKAALEQQGGIGKFSDTLAEDFAISMALKTSGWRIVLSSFPVIQNPGRSSFSIFKSRLIRWCRLRAALMPFTIVGEPFIECFLSGVIGSLSISYITGWSILIVFLIHCLYWFTCDMILVRILENGPMDPIWKLLIAWLTRETCALPILLSSLKTRTITWGGNKYKLLLGGKAVKLSPPVGPLLQL